MDNRKEKGRLKKKQRKKGITDHIQNGGKKRKQSRRGGGHAEEDQDFLRTMLDREVDTILEEIGMVDDINPAHRKPNETEQGIVGTADSN